MTSNHKICKVCNKEKEVTEFYNRSNKCKECHKAYAKAYREKNKDKEREYRKRYYNRNLGYYLYFIYEDNRIVYCGSTVNLNRLNKHISCHSNISDYMKLRRWDKITYIEMSDIKSRDELYLCESICISEIMPSLNKEILTQELDNKTRDKELSEEMYWMIDNGIEELMIIYKENEYVK